jgi:Terminase-like family.
LLRAGAQTDRQHADDIVAFAERLDHPIRYVWIDPSAASLAAELRTRDVKGSRLKVRKAKNDVVDGIRTQAAMLQAGEYAIVRDPSNDQCIRDYGAYLWDQKAQDRGVDKPLQENDHTKDEERYFLHSMFGGRFTPSSVARSLYK